MPAAAQLTYQATYSTAYLLRCCICAHNLSNHKDTVWQVVASKHASQAAVVATAAVTDIHTSQLGPPMIAADVSHTQRPQKLRLKESCQPLRYLVNTLVNFSCYRQQHQQQGSTTLPSKHTNSSGSCHITASATQACSLRGGAR